MSQAAKYAWTQDAPTAEAEVDTASSPESAGVAPDRGTMLAALRDLEAAKGRVERDAKRVLEETREQLIGKLLPVLDNLDRSIAAATETGDAHSVIEGVRLVRSQLEGVLRGYGAERVDAKDQVFDPALHEAVSIIPVPDPKAHGRVIDQLEAGWRVGQRLLRPARVVVGRFTAPPPRPATRWY